MKNLIYILLLAFIVNAKSEVLDDFRNNELINNYGREFHLSMPPSLQDENVNKESYVRVFIGSIKRTVATVEVPAKSFKRTISINPGEINEVVIPPEIAQPYIKQAMHPAEKSKVFPTAGISIISDEDVFVYVVANNNVSNEGYLALPVTALGTRYIVSSFGDGSFLYPAYNTFPSITTIVGAFDNTIVNFTLGGNSSTTSSDGASPYQKETRVINQGDVWVISTQGNFSDLSGSVISSSLPVAVISGNQSANIPIDNRWNDYIVEMLTPAHTWGKKYYTFSIFNKTKKPVFRIFSKFDSTNVYLNGEYEREIFGSGGIIDLGYIELRPENTEPMLDIISSDKPLNVNLYNTGSEEDGLPVISGGPFQLGLIPAEQFTTDALIAMPGTDTYQSGFDETFLVIISKSDANDVKVGQVNADEIIWSDLSSMEIIENEKYADGTNYFLVKMPQRGIFRIKSGLKFGAYIYGIHSSTAFAYPASAELKFLTGDYEKPQPQWDKHCNGNVNGNTTDMPELNASKLANAIFDRTNSYNYEFHCDKIIPGITESVEWSLKVKNNLQNAKAIITFRDKSNNDTTITIYYKAPVVELSPNEHNFGPFVFNEEITDANFKEFTFTNNSDTSFSLEKLEFLYGAEGFSLLDEFTPQIMQPGDSYKFSVVFNPVKSGVCFDSIAIGNDCFFEYLGYVEAEVGVPVIEVKDAEFNNIFEGDIAFRDIYIYNRGKTNLELTDYGGTFTNNFRINGEIGFSTSNPLILKPGESHTFKVEFSTDFTGVYKDSIIIISSADSNIDNVAELNANVIPQGLIADSYNWNKKRIYRDEFPSGPYPIINESNGIKLENTSKSELTITDFSIIENINGDAFEFNRGQIKNLTIQAGDVFILPVSFRPEKTGEHKLVMEYNDNKGGKARTTLKGIGVVPRIQIEDIDFDTCVVDNYDNYKQMNIVIRNAGFSDWEYADTLNLFSIFSDGKISPDWFSFEGKPFKTNYNTQYFPKKIAPGNSIVIKSAFVPIETGYEEGFLEINSDAINDGAIKLFGYGINHDIIVKGAEVSTCINTPVLFETVISNKSTKQIEIESVKIRDNNQGFAFENPDLSNGFSLEPDEEKRIKLYFNPTNITNYSNEVIVATKSEPVITRAGSLEGKVNYAERNIITSPTSKIGKIGEKTNIALKLEDGQDISEYFINYLSINIDFNSSMLSIEPEDISLGDEYRGKFELSSKEIDMDNGRITLTLNSFMDNLINSPGKLIDMNFYVMYPLDSTDKSLISASFESNMDECVQFNTFDGKIDLEHVCMDDLRKFNISGVNYDLQEIAPNPVSSNNISINYSIALDAQTRLELFNSQGEPVRLVINEIQNSGNYNVEVDIEGLSSGLYFYRLQSGPFNKTLPLVIRK